jgi:hypothetical protein
MRQPAQAMISTHSASRCAQKEKHTRQVQAASKRPRLSRMVIRRNDFKIDQRGKKSKGKIRRFKSQTRVHAAQALGGGRGRLCRMARTSLLKEGERGRGRFAATFCFDHCNRRRNATNSVAADLQQAPSRHAQHAARYSNNLPHHHAMLLFILLV